MISLIKLHYSYLFSWKIIYINLIILLVSLVSFIFLSSFYLDHKLLVFYSQYYVEEYMFSSLTLMKIIILLQSMFIVINGFIINKYDVYLLIRTSRIKLLLSKLLTMLLGVITFTVFMYLLFTIIGLFLTPYFKFKFEYIDLLFDLVIFSIVYTLLYIFLIIIVTNMYSLLLVFILYFISDISIEYLVTKNDLSAFTKCINLLFPDIGYFRNTGYDLLYSKLYYLSLCILIIDLIILIYRKTDIIN